MSTMTYRSKLETTMSIGIIGAGALGSNVARLLARSGISATIANSRGPASLASLAGELGPSIKAATVREAATADIVPVGLGTLGVGGPVASLPFGSLAAINLVRI